MKNEKIDFYKMFVPKRIQWNEIDKIRNNKKEEYEEIAAKEKKCPICKKIMILNNEREYGFGEAYEKIYYECTNCRIQTKILYTRDYESKIKALKELQK